MGKEIRGGAISAETFGDFARIFLVGGARRDGEPRSVDLAQDADVVIDPQRIDLSSKVARAALHP